MASESPMNVLQCLHWPSSVPLSLQNGGQQREKKKFEVFLQFSEGEPVRTCLGSDGLACVKWRRGDRQVGKTAIYKVLLSRTVQRR